MTDRVRFSVGVALAVAALAFLFWAAATGARWRGGVDVVGAESYPDGRVTLEVDTCHGNPEPARIVQTDRTVEVAAVSSWGSLFFGGDDCLDAFEIQLRDPLGDRDLIDLHSGKRVRVVQIDPSP